MSSRRTGSNQPFPLNEKGISLYLGERSLQRTQRRVTLLIPFGKEEAEEHLPLHERMWGLLFFSGETISLRITWAKPAHLSPYLPHGALPNSITAREIREALNEAGNNGA
jgi:hypothetical protein